MMVAVLIGIAGCGDSQLDEVDGGSGQVDIDAADELDTAGDRDATDEQADAGAGADGGAPDDGAAAPSGPALETYRVLHWNIAGGKENNCRTPEITRAVVRYVRERNIDFVGLNEVCPAQFESIREALRAYWGKGRNAHFAAFVGDGTRRIVGNAIFSRRNINGVTREKVGEDQYGDRNLLCARLAAYEHLRFCSVHLTPGDTAARRQLRRVHDRIEGWWRDHGDTVILSGDLNIHPNDPGLDAVYSAGANHPRNNPDNRGRYREADDDDTACCPGYGERTLPGTSGGPCRQGGKIDFIFARENRIDGGRYFGNTLDIPNDCTGVCSDHRAVLGQFRLRIRVD